VVAAGVDDLRQRVALRQPVGGRPLTTKDKTNIRLNLDAGSAPERFNSDR
jgi:hypothetical protein